MLCVLILYISGGTHSLKSTPNDRFFEKLFMAIFIYSLSFFQKSSERKSPKKYFSYFVLMFGLAIRLIRQHTTYLNTVVIKKKKAANTHLVSQTQFYKLYPFFSIFKIQTFQKNHPLLQSKKYNNKLLCHINKINNSVVKQEESKISRCLIQTYITGHYNLSVRIMS